MSVCDKDEDTPGEEGDTKFPYPVGTWVAFEFPQGFFSGTITKLYANEDLCEVTFTDGDHADYDEEEICYAIQLYEREFPQET